MPDLDASRRGWAHTTFAIAPDGRLFTGDPGMPRVLVFEPDGSLARSFEVPVTEIHGITLASHRGLDVLWISDPGRKRRPELNYEIELGPAGGQVIAVDLEGEVLARLPKPSLDAYATAPFAPTATAVDEGADEIWVADGYGQSYVHKYDGSGSYVGTLSGEEELAGGRFSCPHCVHLDHRRPVPELYVGDRSNHRIQVYATSGQFRRDFGTELLVAPTDIRGDEDRLLIAEFKGSRIAVLDSTDSLIGYLGENPAADQRPGWPNSLLPDGTIVRNDSLEPGKFMSPHGVAVDGDGNLFVTEYLIGGRVTKLQRLRSEPAPAP